MMLLLCAIGLASLTGWSLRYFLRDVRRQADYHRALVQLTTAPAAPVFGWTERDEELFRQHSSR